MFGHSDKKNSGHVLVSGVSKINIDNHLRRLFLFRKFYVASAAIFVNKGLPIYTQKYRQIFYHYFVSCRARILLFRRTPNNRYRCSTFFFIFWVGGGV